jgi:hypothetical protein
MGSSRFPILGTPIRSFRGDMLVQAFPGADVAFEQKNAYDREKQPPSGPVETADLGLAPWQDRYNFAGMANKLQET